MAEAATDAKPHASGRMIADEIGSRPIPDPTLLTTQQLLRAVEALKELVFTRLDGMDEAIRLFNANITRVPTDTDKQITHLKELIFQRFEVDGERFQRIFTQISERDTRVEQTARDSKVAIDAALSAQEKAVSKQNESFGLSIAKSENATNKQIDQLGDLVTSNNKALDDKITDAKERITRLESLGRGQALQVESTKSSQAGTVGIIGLVIGSVIGATGIILAIVTFATRVAH